MPSNIPPKMKLNRITKMIKDAYKNEIEDMLWEQWLVDYTKMDTRENFVSFEDYKNNAFKTNETKNKNKIKNKDENNVAKILKDAEEARKLVEGR